MHIIYLILMLYILLLQYNDLQSKMPKDIDWNKLQDYETEDNTRGSQELACKSGSCELVDI